MMASNEDVYFDLRNGFETYWFSTLKPLLETKEELRRKYLSWFWRLIFILFVICPILFIALFYATSHGYITSKNIQEFLGGSYFWFLTIVVVLISEAYPSYKREIQKDVMNCFISYFDGFKYEQGKGLSVDEMKKSHVFPAAGIYEADDCFDGSHRGIFFRVTEQILKRQWGHNLGPVCFRGIAVELEMNKNFKGQTVVLKDLGVLNKFKGFESFERITLEDPLFEKLFEVYGTNQVESRFLLTPILMEKIIKLKNLYEGKSVQFSFYDNKVLISIETKKDMFTAYSLFKSNIDKPKIDMVFEQFLTIFSIIDILKSSLKTDI